MLHRKKSKKMRAIFCQFWSALDRKDVVQQIKPALLKACDLVWKWWMPCSISFLPFLSWYIRERADYRSQVHQEHRPLSMLIPKCHIDGWKMSYSKMSYEQNTYFLCWTYTTDGKPRLGHWTWHNKKNSVKLSCFCLNATGLKCACVKKNEYCTNKNHINIQMWTEYLLLNKITQVIYNMWNFWCENLVHYRCFTSIQLPQIMLVVVQCLACIFGEVFIQVGLNHN